MPNISIATAYSGKEMESAGSSDFLAGFDALAQAVRRAPGVPTAGGERTAL